MTDREFVTAAQFVKLEQNLKSGFRLYTKAEFLAGFRPPEFFWGDILQRGYL